MNKIYLNVNVYHKKLLVLFLIMLVDRWLLFPSQEKSCIQYFYVVK